MRQVAKQQEQERRTRARERVLHHREQVTRKVSQTCRFFGISRTPLSSRGLELDSRS